VPYILCQVLDLFIRGLWCKIKTEKSAVIVVFAKTHISLRRSDLLGIGIPDVRVSVDKIPINYLLHVRVREPDGIKLFYDLRLQLLVLVFRGISGNGYLRDLERFAEIRVQIHMRVKKFRIKQGPCLIIYILTLFEEMILHSDRIDTRAFKHIGFDVRIIFVGRAAAILPTASGMLVDYKLIVGKIFFGEFKAPFNVIRLVVKPCFSPLPFHFVGYLDRRYLIGVTLGNLGITPFKLAFYLVNVLIIEPLGKKRIVSERVLTRLDAVRFAEFYAKIGRRTAVYLWRVL